MIFATNNKGKLREIREIFYEYKIKGLREAGIEIDVIEDADTFYGNAYKKAKEIYEITKEAVIADDSGLCIDVLDGFPGVMTHRFLGSDATDEEINLVLLDKMKEYSLNDRSAKVVCNLVYYDGNDILVGEGILRGGISSSIRGENGFGFDPIFELESGKTLAEISSEEKNKCSARYLAAINLKSKLEKN